MGLGTALVASAKSEETAQLQQLREEQAKIQKEIDAIKMKLQKNTEQVKAVQAEIAAAQKEPDFVKLMEKSKKQKLTPDDAALLTKEKKKALAFKERMEKLKKESDALKEQMKELKSKVDVIGGKLDKLEAVTTSKPSSKDGKRKPLSLDLDQLKRKAEGIAANIRALKPKLMSGNNEIVPTVSEKLQAIFVQAAQLVQQELARKRDGKLEKLTPSNRKLFETASLFFEHLVIILGQPKTRLDKLSKNTVIRTDLPELLKENAKILDKISVGLFDTGETRAIKAMLKAVVPLGKGIFEDIKKLPLPKVA